MFKNFDLNITHTKSYVKVLIIIYIQYMHLFI